jgi:hypothetical protein
MVLENQIENIIKTIEILHSEIESNDVQHELSGILSMNVPKGSHREK